MGGGTTKRMAVMLAGVAALVGGIAGINAYKGRRDRRAMAALGPPPQTVSAAPVRYEDWQPTLSAVGTLRAAKGADLAFEGAGVVAQVHTSSGADVDQGQVLVTLQDEAERAQLRQMEAAAALAELTFRRAKDQAAARIISQADYDGAEAEARARRAAAQQQAALAAKKQLRAPFPGRMGILSLSPGTYLAAGTLVATLQQLDPIRMDFHVAQRDLGELALGQKVRVTLDAFPGRTFDGRVTAVNPKVDPATRNVQVEATLPNSRRELVPGMFASVELEVGARRRSLTLPQTAITYNPYGATVFVLRPGGALPLARQVFVVTGPTRGDQVAILKGLEEGDQVVTSGGLKLKNDTPVIVNNGAPPANEPPPAPQEQ